MLNYNKILQNIKKMEWSDITNSQIALAIFCAADGCEYAETEFDGLCRITKTIWSDMDNPNLQIIADCVCDNYFMLNWGYCSEKTLTDKDFDHLSVEKENKLIDAILDRQ
jgi:hypothetical protein